MSVNSETEVYQNNSLNKQRSMSLKKISTIGSKSNLHMSAIDGQPNEKKAREKPGILTDFSTCVDKPWQTATEAKYGWRSRARTLRGSCSGPRTSYPYLHHRFHLHSSFLFLPLKSKINSQKSL